MNHPQANPAEAAALSAAADPLHVLLTNDDGFDSDGIAAMRDALLAAGFRVTVVAPAAQQSGQGTAIDTGKLFQAVAVSEFRPGDFSVDGRPVTTVIAALDFLLAERPDVVVSGINEGENVGLPALASGTLSAAVTALLRGVPAIAVSAQNSASIDETYAAGAEAVTAILTDLDARRLRAGDFLPEGIGLNVNVPAGWKPGDAVAFTRIDAVGSFRLLLPAAGDDPEDGVSFLAAAGDPTGAAPDSEGGAFLGGALTITPVDGDWSTDDATRAALESRLDDLSAAAPDAPGRPLRIMLTNDDGFDSKGLAVMAAALRAAGHEVTIVAPLEPQSGQGTALDLAQLFRVIAVDAFAPGDFSVDSTPVVVTLAGLQTLAGAVDLVVSGINEGQNLGRTTISSGTVSAAATALAAGVPAIAVSAEIDIREQPDFPSTDLAYQVGAAFTVDLISDLIATAGDGPLLPEGVGLSVNVPVGAVTGVSITRIDAVTPLGISFGPVPGGGAGPTIDFAAAPNGDPLSEGSEFLLDRITVTPIDGNYTADDAARAETQALIEAGRAFADFADGVSRVEPISVAFLGEAGFATGFIPDGEAGTIEGVATQVGGLSGIAYDFATGGYYAISDDRAQLGPARFYELTIDIADGALESGDVVFTGVTALRDANGAPFGLNAVDPEGIALTAAGDLLITSEGSARPPSLIEPFVDRFALDGTRLAGLPVDDKFLPTDPATSGIRNNLAFESVTVTPDGRTAYVATEAALVQDGPVAGQDTGSAARIIRYDLATGAATGEFVYLTETIPAEPVAGGFADNGLVELLALDNDGSLLAMERAFVQGVGNTIRIFHVRLQGATDVSGVDALPVEEDDGAFEPVVDQIAQKELLIDLADFGITPDNVEGMTFGPDLPDGRKTLILVSDNNFSAAQQTQFLAFAVETRTVPLVAPILETPSEPRYDGPDDQTEGADADDPAIYLTPAGDGLVVTAMKNGGLRVYDLGGAEIDRSEPADIRYNNVDLVYGFGGFDLAVASDRANDTLALYAIGADGTLTDVTGAVPETIFGVDDGEATAYGLATYTSLIDGAQYVFVTQASGGQIAQLKLVDEGGAVGAELVRVLDLPNPDGLDAEDLQSEGIAVDRETGVAYVSTEGAYGLFAFAAEPSLAEAGGETFTLVADNDSFVPDIEGVSIVYGEDGAGAIVVSSQGDSSFTVLDRRSWEVLGRFATTDGAEADRVEESDGIDIASFALPGFAEGLMVLHDGSDEPQRVFADPEDGEIQNYATNFKYFDLADALGAVGAAPIADDFDPRAVTRVAGEGADTLPQGVAAGDVSTDSAVLWARSTARGLITFEVSTDQTFQSVVASLSAFVADVDRPAKVEVDGLEEGRRYYYRATDAAGSSLTGTFETAEETGYNGLTFGVTGDWRGELAPYPAVANAAGAGLDFFVLLGDTIYADFPSPAVPEPQAETLEEFRLKHAEVYGERGGANFWAELRASTAVFATIDDHEVTNDFAGGAPADIDPRFGETGVLQNDAQLYENGLQAFQEYNPIADLFYGDTGDATTAGERKLYRAQTYGQDAVSIVLDQRSFRDAQLPEADITNPASVGQFLVRSLTEDRTLLGAVQVEDLKADLLAAEAAGVTWKFIHTPEPIQNLGIYSNDSFEGYARERTEILKFIEDEGIDNVVFVAADIHGTFVNNLTYQESVADIAGRVQRASSAWEITTGSVAFDPPFGFSVVEVAAAAGLISPAQRAFYDSLPIAPDTDSIPNDKDDFLKAAFTTIAINPGGFDPIGLTDNLPGAAGRFDATLLEGDWLAAHTFGWTEFDIDAETQALTVTTWGINPYDAAEAAADPAAIAALMPRVVSRFVVEAQANLVEGGDGNDRITGTDRPDAIASGGGRSDIVAGGLGGDRFVFGAETRNGVRETDQIRDYDPDEGDVIDLGAAAVASFRETQASVRLVLDGDGDVIVVSGVSDFDQIVFA